MASKELLKDELYKVLEIGIGGIRYERDTFKDILTRHPEYTAKHLCMDFSKDDNSSFYIPSQLYTENNFALTAGLNFRGQYKFVVEGDDVFVADLLGNKILNLHFNPRADYLNKKTSDVVPMDTIASDSGNRWHGRKDIFVAYSNECSLHEKGLDCLFCNINSTKARYAEKENIQWKNPKQIAETVKAAYSEGYDHFTVTGGFIPERREVDYYIDVAEAIQDELGVEDFGGTACIGAPKDLSVIEKYKEAGWSTIGLNMEVWNKDYFNAICPGKVQECGGYEHWIEAIKYAVEVFGKGNVRSNLVGGLEPKDYLIEGLETLASWGVVATTTTWGPNVGSKLEGHQTPVPEWHWDVQNNAVQILKKNGLTWDKVRKASNGHWTMHELFLIEDGLI